MTIITISVLIMSFIGAASFMCWDNDLEKIPVLYAFGAFLGKWWFHDYLKPGKAHLEYHVSDGPPLVANITQGSTTTLFPYPEDPWSGTGNVTNACTYNYNNALKINSSYTPINGMYGVTNQKEHEINSNETEYYPNAENPNNYIAKRLLGDWANWSDLINMEQQPLFNRNVFKDGDPFFAAKIGNNNENDPRWDEAPLYTNAADPSANFQVPLTSKGIGIFPMAPPLELLQVSMNDYSGAENTQTSTAEYQAMSNTPRPVWYQQDQYGNPIQSSAISAYPSENQGTYEGLQWGVPGSTLNIITPAFYDPYSNAKYNAFSPGTVFNNDVVIQESWGGNETYVENDVQIPGSTYSLTPSKVQRAYITTQLSQENPISNNRAGGGIKSKK